MQANWSLILNVLLLTGVIVAIVRMLRMKRVAEAPAPRVSHAQPPVLGATEKSNDDVIAVRKISREIPGIQSTSSANTSASITTKPAISAAKFEERFQQSAVSHAQPLNIHRERVIPAESKMAFQPTPVLKPAEEPISPSVSEDNQVKKAEEKNETLMIFLLAKENRQLAGYELLQTILAAGLRFGEGHLFHRHQYPNGQGPVLCSLATATASGVFDLQNIGGFSVHGLCLFMQTSGNATIDLERFSIMVDTAKQLSEGLDTYMLDDNRKSWSEASEARYEQRISVEEVS